MQCLFSDLLIMNLNYPLSYLGIIFLKWKKFTASEFFSIWFHIKNLNL